MFSVAFATAMILCQWGFRDALFDSSVAIQNIFDADVVMIHKSSVSTLTWMSTFPLELIDEMRGDPQISHAAEVRFTYMRWGRRGEQTSRLLTAIGVNTREPELYRKDLSTHLGLIATPGQILFDRKSRPEYGDISSLIKQPESVYGMLENSRVKIAGTIDIGASFGADAAAVMSRETLESIMPMTNSGMVEIGLIKLKNPSMRDEFLRSANANSKESVRFITLNQLAKMERDFWDRSKPVGFIFLFGVLMSLFIGTAILFLVLNTIILLHQGDFATLMALGYRRSRLQMSVLNQSLLISLLGYPVGFVIAEIVYGFTRQSTNLLVGTSVSRSFITFLFVFFSSCASGLFAMRRLNETCPSDAFG